MMVVMMMRRRMMMMMTDPKSPTGRFGCTCTDK
jgi:hypothetical protein